LADGKYGMMGIRTNDTLCSWQHGMLDNKTNCSLWFMATWDAG